MSEKQDMDERQMITNLVPQWLALMSIPYVDPSKLRLVGTEMGNEIMLLRAEIEQLRTQLKGMCDLAEENSHYKGKFLAEKHGDAEEIAKARALLAAE